CLTSASSHGVICAERAGAACCGSAVSSPAACVCSASPVLAAAAKDQNNTNRTKWIRPEQGSRALRINSMALCLVGSGCRTVIAGLCVVATVANRSDLRELVDSIVNGV